MKLIENRKNRIEHFKLRDIIKNDLYRYEGASTKKEMIKVYFTEPGANYMVWFRISQRYNNIFTKIVLRRKMFKFGIEIFPTTQIDRGFYIGHFGGITVSYMAKIGKNCNISHGVTIGLSNRGEGKIGAPIIGDNVFIGPGAKLFGNITIGNNVAIGANTVITKDIPDNSVVVGSQSKIISSKGSSGYVNHTIS